MCVDKSANQDSTNQGGTTHEGGTDRRDVEQRIVVPTGGEPTDGQQESLGEVVVVQPPREQQSGTRLVRFYAAAREAAGTSEISVIAKTHSELSAALVEICGARLRQVLAISSLLSDGEMVRMDSQSEASLPGNGPIDILPPFAGG